MRKIFLTLTFMLCFTECFSQSLDSEYIFMSKDKAIFTQLFDNGSKMAFNTDRAIKQLNLTDSVITTILEVESQVSSFCISPDNTRLYIGMTSGVLIVFDIKEQQKLYNQKISDQPITAISANSNGKFATGTKKGELKLWETSSLKTTNTLSSESQYITVIKFSNDNTFVASAGESGKIDIWNTDTGEKFKTLSKHSNWIRSLTISDDGKKIASCGDDHKIYEWDLGNRDMTEPLQELKSLHKGWIVDIKYHFGSDFIVSIGHDNYIVVHLLSDYSKKQFRKWKNNKNLIRQKLFSNGNQQYLNSISILPDGFKMIIGTNNSGIVTFDYFNNIYIAKGSFLNPNQVEKRK